MLKNKELLTLLIRLFLGYIFFSAGICKLTHGNFGQIIGPPWLEESLAKYGLGFFAQIVAVSQVLCGTLLLSQRYSLLGTIMLVPMNVAILAVTISMNWTGTPYVNAVFLGLNLVLLGMEFKKFSFLLKPNHACHIVPVATDYIGQNVFSWLGIGFSLLTIGSTFVNYTLTNITAILAFVSFAATILRSVQLTKLDLALILLPFAAMIGITYGGLLFMMPVVAAIIATEALLLCYRLYLSSRSTIAPETATSASV